MTEIFADSHYFIALLNRRDQYHPAAIEASRRHGSQLVTTQSVLVEVGNALRDPCLRSATEQLIRSIWNSSDVVVIAEGTEPFLAGLDLYGKRPDKAWSLTDCISFAVMQAHGIRKALTGDHHFEQAGLSPY